MEPQALTQVIVDIVLGVAAFFGAWILNNITKTMERLDDDVRKMPLQYVAKEDYRNDIREIKDICSKIFDRLEDKADK
jgi:hypothetical protein